MRLIASICALALTTVPVAAQVGNGSDISGPGLTNGGIAGGTYEAGGFRRTESSVFRTPNGTALWASGEVACAVSAAIPAMASALRDGPLTARPEAGGAVVDDAARTAIWEVMRADSVDRTASMASLEAQLRGDAAPGSRIGRRAAALVRSLAGLLGKGAVCPPQEELIVAEPWENAVYEYDQFQRARRATPGTDAVTGVHAVLATLMAAGTSAAPPAQ